MEEKISALIAAAEEKLAPAFKRLEAIEEIGTPWKRFLPTFLGRRRPLSGRTLPRVHTPFPFACLA